MKKTYSVENSFNEMRIDRWIRNKFGKLPQGLIEKNLRIGNIKLNKKKIKSSFKIKTNDKIDFYNINFSKKFEQKKYKFTPSNQIVKKNENLIIEDNNDFIVINKESGMPVQGGTKSKKNLIDIFKKSKIFEDTKPFTVHRLDKDTSGVLIVAKNRETAQLLTSLFRLRKVHKKYLAVCHGEIETNEGEWNDVLVRYENNKAIYEKAKTIYKVLDKNSISSLVEMKPITGRKHQLRKQLFNIGHPVFGDSKYKLDDNQKKLNKNLMLHSYEIKFMIKEKKYKYVALLPDYFRKFIKTKRLNF